MVGVLFIKNITLLIDKKSCYSTGTVKFFIETFRALGVARGHSVTNLQNWLAFIAQLGNHRVKFNKG